VRVITRLNIGGPAIHTLLLTREMPARGYRTLLVAGNCEAEDGDMSYLVRDGDAIEWEPSLSRSVRPWSNVKALWHLWRLLRRERPAIVHTHTAMAGCLGRVAAILSGVPIIVHTFHGNSLSQYFSSFQSALFRRIEQILARFTDVLCVVAAQQAEELSKTFQIAPKRRFRVVPLGLELDDYFNLPLPPPGPFTVGWFGRMAPVKNVPLLAATIEESLSLDPDMHFLIAGDGPECAALAPVLQRHTGRVEWLGWQREILPAVARCNVLLQTSRNEGTPVALIQGMAAARPFVSTAVGGVIEMTAGGLLADADPKSLAATLLSLAKDHALTTRIGLAGRAFAARMYRKEALIENLDALYRELLQRKTELI
jgi:glycosyltransferase involved in cell wall biosynthesis